MEPQETLVESPTPIDTEGSLADHEATFGPQGTGTLADAEETPEPVVPARHRATSQKASAEDVEQINALTKDLRTKEQELAKLKPDAMGGSPRLRALQRQIKALELELGDATPKPPVAAPEPVKAAPAPVAEPAKSVPRGTSEPFGATFSEKEPTLDQFASEPDPYAAWLRAINRYDRKKEAWDADQTAQQTQRETQERAFVAQVEREKQSFIEKRAAFITTHPDYNTVVQSLDDRGAVPPMLVAALMRADNGPELLYSLARNQPDLYDELHLLTFDRPFNESLVASVQRRLTSRMQAASTGTVAPPRITPPPPRPPMPVRTGPLTTGDELPGDESSLAAHEKAFSPKPRR